MAEPTQRSIDMVNKALEMEEKGKKFYGKALDKCKNELGRDIFAKLKADEDVHIERIKEIYKDLTDGKGWTEAWKQQDVDDSGLKDIFRKLAKKHGEKIDLSTDDIDALKVGMDFEQKSVDFYQKHLDLTDDEVEKNFVAAMVDEERGHYTALADMKFYVDNPEAWFEEKGRSLLDGA